MQVVLGNGQVLLANYDASLVGQAHVGPGAVGREWMISAVVWRVMAQCILFCTDLKNAMLMMVTRAICTASGYSYPEICTPMELFPEDNNDV